MVIKLLSPEVSPRTLKRNFMCISDRAEIAHEVLAYLIDHAEAGDTFEGIVEWWLLEQRIRRGSTEVREALEQLAEKQLISEYTRHDRKVHYRINHLKEKEIRVLVERKDL